MTDCMIYQVQKRPADPIQPQPEPVSIKTFCFCLDEFSALNMSSCSINGFSTHIKAKGSLVKLLKCYFSDSIGSSVKLKQIRLFHFEQSQIVRSQKNGIVANFTAALNENYMQRHINLDDSQIYWCDRDAFKCYSSSY